MELLNCLPINIGLVNRIFTSFSDLYIDSGIIYSLSIARVFELRGHEQIIHLSINEAEELMIICSEIANEDSALGLIFTRWTKYQIEKKRKHTAVIQTFEKYIPYVLNTPLQYNEIASIFIIYL